MTESQEKWPFGPAPKRACPKAEAHDWKIIDLFRACDPPAPSFECAHCGYLWSRDWTKPEYRAFLDRLDPASRDYYAMILEKYRDEPPYVDD